MKTDILIAGSGCSGLYCALKLPRDKKSPSSPSPTLPVTIPFLAQGGMCMLKEQSDYDSFFEDTMKAGHYENDKKSVEIMINLPGGCQGSCLLRCPVRAKRRRQPCLHQRRRPFHQPYYFPRGCNRKRDHQHPAPRSPRSFPM